MKHPAKGKLKTRKSNIKSTWIHKPTDKQAQYLYKHKFLNIISRRRSRDFSHTCTCPVTIIVIFCRTTMTVHTSVESWWHAKKMTWYASVEEQQIPWFSICFDLTITHCSRIITSAVSVFFILIFFTFPDPSSHMCDNTRPCLVQ